MTEVAIRFQPRRHAASGVQTALQRHYPARVARQLALAHLLQRRIDAGEFGDYADMARAFGLSRARITQLMDLLLLAPDIQEEVLHLECRPGRQPLPERALRTMSRSPIWQEQRAVWRDVKAALASVVSQAVT